MKNTLSILPEGRQQLTAVIQSAGDIIVVDDAVSVLGGSRNHAAKALARWMNQGWLRRIGRGRYVPATLDTLTSRNVLSDPWVIIPALFDPAYVGGRSAAEHWDLTEQIFNDIVVFTSRSIRHKSQLHHGVTFTLKHLKHDNMFGTKTVWRERSKVAVSDVHRTIIDMLDDPFIGGGIQQVADCLGEYFRRADRSDSQLIKYAERLGNGAVFKRLGFLSDGFPEAQRLAAECAGRLTSGNTKLDPALDCSRLITRWNLWVPEFWTGRGRP